MADMKDQCSGKNNIEVSPIEYKGLSWRDSVSNVFRYDTI